MSTMPLRHVIGAVRAASKTPDQAAADAARPKPFITIARQAGAGGTTLARALCERLNAGERADPAWQMYDRELAEQIARDANVSEALVESLEDETRNWITELAQGLAFKSPSEEQLFRKLATLARALAARGHVILVGRGGVQVAGDMPGGVHLYLVAPLEQRVRNFAALNDLGPDDAGKRVRELDANRAEFHRRLAGKRELSFEQFDMVLNTARVHTDVQLELVESLLSARVKAT